MKEKKPLLSLFFSMLKIGLFTFGGGYAMLALLEDEFADKKKWITAEEFMDMVAISESTPGPIAINSATYIGYKVGGVLGSAVATLGVCIPSFVIIYLISLFFDAFLALAPVTYAFRGIQACVVFLILRAGLKMVKKLPQNALSYVLFGLTLCCMIAFSLLAVSFSAIFYIIIGAAAGICVYCIGRAKKRGDRT